MKVQRSAIMFIVPAAQPSIVAQQLFAIECDNAAQPLSGSEGGRLEIVETNMLMYTALSGLGLNHPPTAEIV